MLAEEAAAARAAVRAKETRPSPLRARVATEVAPMTGSGPLRTPRDASGMQLWGQVRIGGQAPPGSLLDLGGHAYRVGPGGGFAFDLQIEDPELIHALLRLLPALPVAPREPE
jgi:hypothetical protein